MKRDMDLVRTILQEIEEHESLLSPVHINASGYSPDQITYHLKLLNEAGLIEATETTTLREVGFIPKCLTWRGHEFLDAARNETIWQKAKAVIKDRGASIPF